MYPLPSRKHTVVLSWGRAVALMLTVMFLLGGAALMVRAATQSSAAWRFKPIASALPPGTELGFTRDVGEQGELVVKYYTHTLEAAITNHGIAFGGALTPIIVEGQPAPGGGTFKDTDSFYAYAASPTLVYFTVDIDLGSETPIRHYRWSSSTLTHLPTQANESYDVTIHDSHGKFIFKRTVDAENTEYRTTDGMTFSDPITLHNDGINDNPNTSQQLIGITADGAFLIHELITSGTPNCTRAPTLPSQPDEGSFTTRLFWLGSRSGDVVTGSGQSNGCGGSGTNIETPVMNSAGDILSREYSYVINPDGTGVTMVTTLRLYPGTGEAPSVVAQGEHVDDVGPYFFPIPKAITEWRQPIFSASADRNSAEKLYTGPNPTTDQFDGDFFSGFGQDGEALTLYHFSEKGYVIVLAQLADDTYADAIGSAAGAMNWIDPDGGSWGDAGNWDSGEVPGSTSETLFNLDATYTVTVGARDVGRVRIEDGFVSFADADLTLIGPLTLGNDATFDLTSGMLDTGELVVGSLPPADILNPPTAHVQLSNQGTVLTGTTAISISHASPGSMFLDDATIYGGSLVIGENFQGSAALSGDHATWFTEGATAVGFNYTGTLSIESGAFMRSKGEVVIGRGSSLQDYTSLVQVQNFDAPLPNLGANWLLLDTLTIGNFLRGELHLSHGGAVVLFGQDDVLQAGLRAHPGPAFDAFISVDGSDDTRDITSTLEVFNDVLLGMAEQASVGVNVNRGGHFFVDSANLFLGFMPGSEAVMTVAGIDFYDSPALVRVKRPEGNFETGICAIGEGGAGQLLIHSGGQVDCGTIRIGGQPGSNGFVQVDGANGSSSLTTEGGLCIGGDLIGLCGAAETGPQGTLKLKNNASVSAGRGTLVGPGGKIIGSGDIAVGVLGFNVEAGGVVDPGVTVLTPQARALSRASANATAEIETGTLTISGNVTLSPTAQVVLDVLGPTNHDRLIVNGDVTLAGGVLTLAFGYGYAPQQGDTFQFLTADNVTGVFSDVVVTGLEPGFQFDLDASGGAVTLTALNNGVATTDPVLSIADAATLEGNAGTHTLAFTVTLSAANETPVTVTVNTSDGTAIAGSDYVALTGQTVVIPAGQTNALVNVTINGDTEIEADETFTVTLSNPSGSLLVERARAVGTIRNDDGNFKIFLPLAKR